MLPTIFCSLAVSYPNLYLSVTLISLLLQEQGHYSASHNAPSFVQRDVQQSLLCRFNTFRIFPKSKFKVSSETKSKLLTINTRKKKSETWYIIPRYNDRGQNFPFQKARGGEQKIIKAKQDKNPLTVQIHRQIWGTWQ